MKNIISIKSLNKHFVQPSGDKLTILNNLDFHIKENSFISIIGHSGSGKSTLLNILGLLDLPSSFKELKVCGENIEVLSNEERTNFRGKNLGFIFQFHQLLPEFSALQNVMLPMKIMGKPQSEAKEKAMELLAMVFSEDEMKDKVYQRREAQLSGGQCQRVAIARSLANNPPIIFADEPTGSLDPISAKKVMNILKALPSQGKTVIMITHQMDLAGQSDEIYGLLGGKLINKTNEIKARLNGNQTKDIDRICPICKETVKLEEISYNNKILIDKCPKCNGVWLDSGELEMISLSVENFCAAVEKIVKELK